MAVERIGANRLWRAASAALLAALLVLGLASAAWAGQIVYVHGLDSAGNAGDLWVMNDDGSDQRPLLTQAQAGASELSQPNLRPSDGALAFQGETPAPDGSCQTFCVSITTLVDGALHRISPAPVSCTAFPGQSCLSKIDNTPTLTADGRVLYLDTGAAVSGIPCGFYWCGYAASGNQYPIQSDLGGDQPNVWPIPTGSNSYYEPAGSGGVDSSPAADPADPHLIAYPGWEDPANPSYQVNPLVVDDDTGQHPFIVSDDDVTQDVVAWSPDGRYLLDIEGGTTPGIWAYTAQPRTAAGWKAYYVLATPPQTANGGGLGYGLTITADGRILLDSDHDLYSLPAACGPIAGAAAPTTGTPAPNCTLAQAARLTTGADSEYATWTSLTTPLSYTPPTGGGGGTGGGGTGGSSGGGGGGGTGGKHVDEVRGVGLAQRTVRAGRPVTFAVRLRTRARIVVAILRLVPASGHGSHRRRAHYKLVGMVTFAGRRGLNRLRVVRVHGRRLAPGGYQARVSAGGRAHVVKFKVRR